MPDQEILTEPYGSVLADAAVPCVIVQFRGFANPEEFKRIMDTGLTYHQAHSTAARPWGWVGDTREMAAIPQVVQQWLTEDWNRRAYAAGIREISVVVSQNVFGQLATDLYSQKTREQLDRYELVPAYYDSLAAAKQGAARRLAASQAPAPPRDSAP